MPAIFACGSITSAKIVPGSEAAVVDKVLVVGLGNPGRHYRNNRHNAGYMLIDRLLESRGSRLGRSVAEALVADDDARTILAKPQTYVNESGRSVAGLVRTFEVELSNVLIAFDELDLPLGTTRMRPFGGSSGHGGMRSIINHLGGQEFPRLRLGIGRPQGGGQAADYVLTDFSSREIEELDWMLHRGVSCVQRFVADGIQAAMTECNTLEAE